MVWCTECGPIDELRVVHAEWLMMADGVMMGMCSLCDGDYTLRCEKAQHGEVMVTEEIDIFSEQGRHTPGIIYL